MNTNIPKNWLCSRPFDLLFILAPSYLSVLFVLIFSESLSEMEIIPGWAWFILILGIDVSHVYSTLFRTYFHSDEFSENKTLYTLLPIIVFVSGVFLYSIGSIVFWRCLAYIAVFHFIRQQYGFMRLYSRNDSVSSFSRIIDALLIYISMLYPIVYWHTHLPRNFHWFVGGDFILGLPGIFSPIFLSIYLLILIIYLTKETLETYVRKTFNLPKNLILMGTALSWYTGIVFLNADLIFTITNVISHGIPYIALIWMYGKKQSTKDSSILVFRNVQYRYFFSRFSFPLFFLTLLLFGYIEEGLWAGFVWREHLDFFVLFERLPVIRSTDTLTWLVPLLTLPQGTHYILDGFIWKLKDKDAHWISLLR